MTAEQYVRDIITGIKCSGRHRKQIREELLSDINSRVEKGLSLEEVMKQMGRPSEIADKYNDNMPESEIKKYNRTRRNSLLMPILTFIFVLIGSVIYVIPRQKDISGSKYFDEQVIKTRLQDDIAYLNARDYGSLGRLATPAMSEVLTKDDLMETIQRKSGGDWGAFGSLGDPDIVEVNQAGQRYAVAEIQANYENKTVTFRFTYDTKMRLAGLYVN